MLILYRVYFVVEIFRIGPGMKFVNRVIDYEVMGYE